MLSTPIDQVDPFSPEPPLDWSSNDGENTRSQLNLFDQPREIRLWSLWQPWASLVAHGLKLIETRPKPTSYRELVAIQAASRETRQAKIEDVLAIYETLRALGGTDSSIEKLDRVLGNFIKGNDDLPYGSILCVAELKACLLMTASASDPGIKKKSVDGNISILEPSPLEIAVGNWEPGRFAFPLDNIRPIAQPIPYRGSQGLRRITDAAVLAEIDRQLSGL